MTDSFDLAATLTTTSDIETRQGQLPTAVRFAAI
jgi:hypothetical protein